MQLLRAPRSRELDYYLVLDTVINTDFSVGPYVDSYCVKWACALQFATS